jgi:hypothetical protein
MTGQTNSVGGISAVGASVFLAVAATFGFGFQPQARPPAAAQAEGLVAQVERLERELREVRAELEARKIEYHVENPAQITVGNGWTSTPVAVPVRKGDQVRVSVAFDAMAATDGWYWTVETNGPKNALTIANSGNWERIVYHDHVLGQEPPAGLCRGGWHSQNDHTVFTADENGEMKFWIRAGLFAQGGKGEIRFLKIIAENLGKR